MGCDIHLYVEKRDALGQWQSADTWEPNPYYEGDDDEGEPQMVIPYGTRFYDGRNYGLFAILADVRNGVGFAGIKTGDGYQPIAQPRGLPNDMSAEVAADAQRWESDGHSYSWFMLQDLLDYDWTQSTDLQGWLHAMEFWRWEGWARNHGESPQGWSGDIFGGMVEKLDEDTMRERIQTLRAEHPNDFEKALQKTSWYVQCFWTQYYYQVAQKFLGLVIPRLLKLSEGDYTSVRIVFWFDN